MRSTSIEAWAVPVKLFPLAEHTYVVIEKVMRAGCHGRSQGGRLLESSPGDVRMAICLAQPDGGAGVRYGISGVCHQAANRILYAAGTSTLRARGARQSLMAWGLYGIADDGSAYSPATHPWTELANCAGTAANPPAWGGDQ